MRERKRHRALRNGLSSLWLYVAILVWGTAITSCVIALTVYESTPTPLHPIGDRWPSDSEVEFKDGSWNLVMFVHPRCPCSKASLKELSDLLNNTRRLRPISVRLVVYRPSHATADWSDLQQECAALSASGVEIVDDPEGEIARLFQAESSGLVTLFNPERDLEYFGGITPGRGMTGFSHGSDTVLQVLSIGESAVFTKRDPKSSPVYGCSIFTLDSSSQKSTPDAQ